MVTILNFITILIVALCSWLTIRYSVLTMIDANAESLSGKAFRIVGCVLSVSSVAWFITFVWLTQTGFIKMKIFLWVREIYFAIQSGHLLELLLK